jgi:glycosyltransferase involved in cell wall biosynthesis
MQREFGADLQRVGQVERSPAMLASAPAPGGDIAPHWASQLTVITPTYNSSSFMAPTARSVLSISGLAEWIIIDNRSTDDTPAMVERLSAAHGRIRWLVNERNLGHPFPSLVRGLRLATTKYVLFLDSDDVIADPEAVREAITFMEKNDAVRAAIMSIGYMTEAGHVYKERRLPFARYDAVAPGWLVRAIIYFYPVYPVKQSAIIFRRDLLMELIEFTDITLLIAATDVTDFYLVRRVGLHYRNRFNGNSTRIQSENYWWWILRWRFPKQRWWWLPLRAFLLVYKQGLGVLKRLYRRFSVNRI